MKHTFEAGRFEIIESPQVPVTLLADCGIEKHSKEYLLALINTYKGQ